MINKIFHFLHRQNESDLNYRAIVELSPYMIWHADAEGHIIYVNQTVIDYCQRSLDEIVRDGWLKSVHPDDHQRIIENWKQCREKSSIIEIEYRIADKSKTYRWFLVKAKPIVESCGKISRWIGHAVDVHDRKMAIIAYQNAIAARDKFMSLASHELRTPLTSIKLQMQFLIRQVKKKDISLFEFDHLQEVAQSALKQVDQLDLLIEEMLDVSRISSGRMVFSFCSCDLEKIVKHAIAIVSPHYHNARIPLDVAIEPNLPIVCDEHKISQVVINLLTNALKYGAGNPVSISARKVDQHAQIEVIDMGLGIPVEAQKRIFEPFERVSNRSGIAGLGLGLYISKEVIQAHKGKISVQSKLKKGSKFVLEIPLVQNQMKFF